LNLLSLSWLWSLECSTGWRRLVLQVIEVAVLSLVSI
jgi:hypothetical protein